MRFGIRGATTLLIALQVSNCAVFEGRGAEAREPRESTTATPPLTEVDLPEPEAPLIAATVGDQAPFELSASDGTGLKLVAVRSNTVIQSPLALTELALEFDNPEERVIEGRFSITLPEGASVSRFAMQIGDVWQEGEVVEKQRARESYETFLHQRKDPALLEQGAGNQFSARVFPIPAKARKRLIITYAEVLDESHPFRVRLRGLPRVERLDVRVQFDGTEHRISEKGVVPSADWTMPAAPKLAVRGLASERRVVLRGQIPDGATDVDPLTSTVILVDTSAGRALDLDDELAAVVALVANLPDDARVAVLGFDQEVIIAFEGAAKGFGDAQVQALKRRGAFGASDLTTAMKRAVAHAVKSSIPRIVVFSDGVASMGEADAKAMQTLAALAQKVGVERTDVVAVGGIRDGALLAELAKRTGKRSGVVTDMVDDPSRLVRRLTRKTIDEVPLKVAGSTWQSASTLEGLQPGDDFVVFAELETKPGPTLAVNVGSARLDVPIEVTASKELLERSHAVARIAELERSDEADETLRKRIVALSTQHRILSRHTAMVVLESDSDYARFGIDRAATVDVLGIEGTKIVTHKGARPLLGGAKSLANAWDSRPEAPQRSAPGPDPEGARGNMWGQDNGDAGPAGGLGLHGVGEGGGGRGEGIGLGAVGAVGRGAGTSTGQGFGSGQGRLGGSHRSRPPQVRMGATQVSGRIPPEVIQRIVRQNFGRFRGCYEEGLLRNPTLSGRVSVRFSIATSGAVSSARAESSTMASPVVERCVANAFTSLSFPAPESGSVIVVYPILFSTGDAPPPARPSVPIATRTEPPMETTSSPYEGRFKTVMDSLAEKQGERALNEALRYRADTPSDVLALVAIGEAAEATGRPRLAARAYGSILDLWSYRVEMKRFAAQRLERIGTSRALEVAIDAYASANRERLDHPSGYRFLAYATLKSGDPKRAFETIEKALTRTYPDGRYRGVLDVLRQDAGILARAWMQSDKSLEIDLKARLDAIGAKLDDAPSTRFVLSWETDANDVDLHVTDALGEHASYQHKALGSGGALVADVTTGYGPEAFVIPGAAKAFPYRLSADYYSRGVMGFGMGKIQIVRHDGGGRVDIEERPFVIQTAKGRVDLGVVGEFAAK